MNIYQIIVMKETREGEGRVALTPRAVGNLLAHSSLPVFVEAGAGNLAGFSDEAYVQAGARIITLTSKLPSHSLVIRVKRPTLSREAMENTLFSDNTIMLGFLDPFDVGHEGHMSRWKALGILPIALELLPLSSDDSRNAQAAMSGFAGRLALQDALRHYQGSLPKKVAVFGTGPAGVSAALAAKEAHLEVTLFGRKEKYRQQIESMGILYDVLPTISTQNFLKQHLRDTTLIVAAARVVGERTSVIIDADILSHLPDNTVLIDLSAGEGGCIAGSQEDTVVHCDRGIKIVNVSGYPKTEPAEASEAFASCMVNLLKDIMTPTGTLKTDHLLLQNLSKKIENKIA
jgi:NAD(P) transhydrogenase subunit alpha